MRYILVQKAIPPIKVCRKQQSECSNAQAAANHLVFFICPGRDVLLRFSSLKCVVLGSSSIIQGLSTLAYLIEHVRTVVQAAKLAPSIIFLDEIDGLLPARSTREGGSDQIYASVVTTMLALMDGISDRGSVVVVAATNRCKSPCQLRGRNHCQSLSLHWRSFSLQV